MAQRHISLSAAIHHGYLPLLTLGPWSLVRALCPDPRRVGVVVPGEVVHRGSVNCSSEH
jgi:hypothetical protein